MAFLGSWEALQVFNLHGLKIHTNSKHCLCVQLEVSCLFFVVAVLHLATGGNCQPGWLPVLYLALISSIYLFLLHAVSVLMEAKKKRTMPVSYKRLSKACTLHLMQNTAQKRFHGTIVQSKCTWVKAKFLTSAIQKLYKKLLCHSDMSR